VLLASGRPRASYEVLVDAQSAAVVRVRDRLKHDTGKAALFMPNPIVTHGSRDVLVDDDDADSTLLTSLRTPVTLQRLRKGTICLQGRFVHATLPDGEVCAPGADFAGVTRADDQFEALMAYVHVDRTAAYLESLGLITRMLMRPLPVVANGSEKDDSDYDPAMRLITLGSGGVDDGEDADTIVHEYGHALQDAQVPDFGESDQGGAIGSGFGDYLQAATDAQRATSATFNPCMSEWDGMDFSEPAPVQCVRRTDGDLTAADVGPGTECDTESHCAGEVWSGALWRIRALIGGTTADRLVVQSHFALTSTADFVDGSIALIVADRALYGGVHEQVLRDVLNERGLLDHKWPFMAVTGKLPRKRTVQRTRSFRVTVEVSEPGTVRVSALLRRGSNQRLRVAKSRNVTFAVAGKRRVTFKVTRAGLRRLKARRRAVLRIRARATCASGRTFPVVEVSRRLR